MGGGGEEREWGGRGESTLDLARHGRGGAELIGETKVKATRSLFSKWSASPSIYDSAEKTSAFWSDVDSCWRCAADFVSRL